MDKNLQQEMNKGFAQIWKEYNDPECIKKKEMEKRRNKIKEERSSDYCL